MLPILDQLFLFHKLLPVCTLQWVEIVFEVAFLVLFTHLCPHTPLIDEHAQGILYTRFI